MSFILLRRLLFSLVFSASVAVAQNNINLDTNVKGSRPPYWAVDSGTANAYVVTTFANSGFVLRVGSHIDFLSTHANTGASTLVVNGITAHSIVKNGSTALVTGDIYAALVEVVWDGTNYQLLNGSVDGNVGCSQMPALIGDVNSSAGNCTTTVVKVDGVSYPTDTSTNTVPVKTSAGAVTYEAVPNAALANSATTVNGQTCTLGSPCTVIPPLATGTSVSLSLPYEIFVCTGAGACTVTPPVPAAGYEFCVLNDDNVATVITLAALGSSARYENTARTAYGTAGTGTLVSGGAVKDMVCIVGRDATHYLTTNFTGTWTAN